MPLTLPTDQGWYINELIHGRYIVVFEIVKDPEDDEWDTSSSQYVEDRRAFWSEADGQGLAASLNAANEPWIHTDRLYKISKIQRSAGDLRSWGSIGVQSVFDVEIANEDGLLEDLRDGTGQPGTGASSAEATGEWTNRWARIGLMHADPAGTLAYPGSVVWLASGRIARVEPTRKSWKVYVEDDRLQGRLDIPRTVYQNDESVFVGFRAQNSIHGRPKPWLFGHVPIAEGQVVILGYEDTTASTLRGRQIEFYGADESWQAAGSVSDLRYGNESLVDGTDTRGFLEINSDTGGFVSTRSEYSTMSNGRAFFFDNFNEEWLYLKMDVRLSYADTLRDTGARVADVTDPTNVVDWRNFDSYAEMPSRFEASAVDDAYAFVPIPWPYFGGFSMEIEGSWTGSWRDRDMQPPTPGIEIGMYCFLKFDTGALLAADGAYVFVSANNGLWSGGGSYAINTTDGPARFFEGNNDIDNFTSGDRELYRMLHRDNNSDGSGPSTGTIYLADFETSQGDGRAILFGVCAPNGEGGGASAIAAGVKLYNLGIRIWGRIKFPKEGWYADAYGYTRKADFDAWASGINLGDTYDSPLGLVGLFLDRILPTQGPHWYNFLIQDGFWTGHGFEVGKQITDKGDGFDELNNLCEDSHVLMTGSDSLHQDVVGNETGAEGHRAVYLPKLPNPSHRFNDTGVRVTPSSPDVTMDSFPVGALESGLVPGSVDPYKARMEDVYTRFVYKYRYNPMRGEYDGIAVISPTEWDLGEYLAPIAGTWLDQTTIQAQLAAAQVQYRRKPEIATLTWEASWVHDPATAEYLLAFLAINSCGPRHGVRFATGLLPIHVRLGDVVEFEMRDAPDEWLTKYAALEPGEDERLYIVAGKEFDPRGRFNWDLMEVKPLERFSGAQVW